METLKVLLSTADYPPFASGGLARYSTELFEALRTLGADVTLVAPVPLGDPPYEDGAIASFPMPFYDNRVLKYPIFNIMSLRSKREHRYDIIHSLSTQHEMGLSRILTSNLVLTVHNTFAQQLEMGYSNPGLDRMLRKGFYTYMSYWERMACLAAKKVIAVSKGTRDSLVQSYGLPPKKIKVIYSGVDLVKFRKREDLSPTYGLKEGYFLFVGRIVPRKGVEYALRAFHLVKRELNEAKFVIIGTGERAYQESLIRLARQLKLEEDIQFLGGISDRELPAFYQNASLVIFPSLVEGFGLACLEAMACGKPVIASDISGIREIITDGENGILVPPKDPAALARAIELLVNNEGIVSTLSARALKRSESFSWAKTAREVYSCYRDVTLN